MLSLCQQGIAWYAVRFLLWMAHLAWASHKRLGSRLLLFHHRLQWLHSLLYQMIPPVLCLCQKALLSVSDRMTLAYQDWFQLNRCHLKSFILDQFLDSIHDPHMALMINDTHISCVKEPILINGISCRLWIIDVALEWQINNVRWRSCIWRSTLYLHNIGSLEPYFSSFTWSKCYMKIRYMIKMRHWSYKVNPYHSYLCHLHWQSCIPY